MVGYIYRVRCTKTDKIYVGSARNPTQRWMAHLSKLRNGKHHSIHLQRAFSKHGEDCFFFEVMEYVHDDLFLLAREQFWIWRNASRLYNASPTAGSPLGVKHSKETRAKQSRRMSGNTIRRGTLMPATAKERISDSLKGNSRRKGVPHSPEIKAKISEGLKRAHSEGRRQKVDIAISIRNLEAWNAKLKAGEVRMSWKKEERNVALIQAFAENRSLSITGGLFGIKPKSAYAILRAYAPELLGAHGRPRNPETPTLESREVAA